MQCSALRKGGYVLIKSRPCKVMNASPSSAPAVLPDCAGSLISIFGQIVDMSTSKTGKHGHAKVHLVGIDVCSSHPD